MRIDDITSKEKLVTPSKNNPYKLEIPLSYYQIDKSDSASAEIIGIFGA